MNCDSCLEELPEHKKYYCCLDCDEPLHEDCVEEHMYDCHGYGDADDYWYDEEGECDNDD